MAKTPKTPKTEGQPESVTLTHPYGYRDDEDVLHFWNAGQVVTDAGEVADLLARKAPLAEVAPE